MCIITIKANIYRVFCLDCAKSFTCIILNSPPPPLWMKNRRLRKGAWCKGRLLSPLPPSRAHALTCSPGFL